MEHKHELKSWVEFYQDIVDGRKKHDLRRSDDRDFSVGDVILLREYDFSKNEYTGKSCLVRVTYITSESNPCALSREAIREDFCILSIEPVKR